MTIKKNFFLKSTYQKIGHNLNFFNKGLLIWKIVPRYILIQFSSWNIHKAHGLFSVWVKRGNFVFLAQKDHFSTFTEPKPCYFWTFQLLNWIKVPVNLGNFLMSRALAKIFFKNSFGRFSGKRHIRTNCSFLPSFTTGKRHQTKTYQQKSHNFHLVYASF